MLKYKIVLLIFFQASKNKLIIKSFLFKDKDINQNVKGRLN